MFFTPVALLAYVAAGYADAVVEFGNAQAENSDTRRGCKPVSSAKQAASNSSSKQRRAKPFSSLRQTRNTLPSGPILRGILRFGAFFDDTTDEAP